MRWGWGQEGAEVWSEGRGPVLMVCSTSGCKGLSDTSFDAPPLSCTCVPEGPQAMRVSGGVSGWKPSSNILLEVTGEPACLPGSVQEKVPVTYIWS